MAAGRTRMTTPSRSPCPGGKGRLDFIPAGSDDDTYVRLVQELDWAELYERGFGEFLEECRRRWKDMYDFVLIDSRTGITDMGGICTAQLPEILVMLFTANEQSLRGTVNVARRAARPGRAAVRPCAVDGPPRAYPVRRPRGVQTGPELAAAVRP